MVHICIVTEGRGASADGLAAATEHAPARIPNRRRLLVGALAQHLQHVRMVHICIVIERRGVSADGLAAATEHAPGRIPSRRQPRGGAITRRLQRVPLLLSVIK